MDHADIYFTPGAFSIRAAVCEPLTQYAQQLLINRCTGGPDARKATHVRCGRRSLPTENLAQQASGPGRGIVADVRLFCGDNVEQAVDGLVGHVPVQISRLALAAEQ